MSARAARSSPASSSIGKYSVDAYDEDCAAAGLELAERWATWDRQPFTPTSDYAVSVHRPRST